MNNNFENSSIINEDNKYMIKSNHIFIFQINKSNEIQIKYNFGELAEQKGFDFPLNTFFQISELFKIQYLEDLLNVILNSQSDNFHFFYSGVDLFKLNLKIKNIEESLTEYLCEIQLIEIDSIIPENTQNKYFEHNYLPSAILKKVSDGYKICSVNRKLLENPILSKLFANSNSILDDPDNLLELQNCLNELNHINSIFDKEVKFIYEEEYHYFTTRIILIDEIHICLQLVETTSNRNHAYELQLIRNYLEMSQSLGKFGYWEYDAENNKITVSDAIKNVYGVDENYKFETNWIDLFEESYRQIISDYLTSSVQYGYDFDIIVKLNNSLCKNKWVRIIALPLVENNKIIKIWGLTQNISEDVENIEKLDEQSKILDLVGQAIAAIDINGLIYYWNKNAEELYGWTKNEALGNYGDLIIPNEYRDTVYKDIIKHVGKGVNYSNEITVIKKDGTKFLVKVIINPIQDITGNVVGAVGISYDITEQKRQDKLIKDSEEKFRMLFENSSNGILVINKNFEIVTVNKTATELLGYSKVELLGNNFEFLIPERFREGHKEYTINSFKSKKQRILNSDYNKFVIFKRDKTELPINININFINIDGEILAFTEFTDISKQKEFEDKLISTDIKLKAILNNSEESFILLDRNFRISALNEMARKTAKNYMNCEIEEGSSIFDLIKNEDAKRFLENFQIALNGQKAFSEKKFNFENNITRWYKFIYIPVEGTKTVDNVLLVSIDITESKNYENRLKLKNQAIESSNNAIIFTDFDGIINYANPSFYELWNYKKDVHSEELNINQLWIDPKISKYILDKTKEDKLLNYEVSAKCFDGTNKNIILQSTVINDFEDNPESIMFSFVDITSIRKYEKELIKAKTIAEESDKLKTAFLSNISHEIRTPMNAIKGFVQLSLEPNTTILEKEYFAQIITESTDRLLELINDVLDLSKVESGVYEFEMAEFSLNSLLLEIFDNYAPKAKEKAIKLVPLLPDKDRIIFSDRKSISKIISNLINNALKFTEHGSIDFGYNVFDHDVSFYVKDTGIGISEDNYEAIFDRFRQIEDFLTKTKGGIGLGLSLCKALVSKLGGKINVTSELGKGSLFRFIIPLLKEPRFASFLPHHEIDFSELDLKGMKVLIVEDEDIVRKLLSRLIEKINGIPFDAPNAKNALKILGDVPNVEIIITDIKLPDFDGFELVKKIRKFNAKVKIIAQTAFAYSYDRRFAIESGCDEFITKPVLSNDLYKAIKSVLT